MKTNHTENKGLSDRLRHYQSRLLPYAYNILGDFMAAEDIVQETLNHYFLNPHDFVQKEDAYLIKSVINRSINQKNLLRNKKEQYMGQWLPSPITTEEGIYARVDRSQIMQYSLMVLLEKLSPVERAVFILKETFEFSHPEIAKMLDISPDNSRQLLKRGRQKLELDTLPSYSLEESNQPFIQELTQAILGADLGKIKDLLTADIQALSDGGTKMRTARNIIYGKENVFKLLQAIHSKYMPEGASFRTSYLNHTPAILYSANNVIFRCLILEVKNGVIHQIYTIIDPDKLKNLQNLDESVTPDSAIRSSK